MRLFIALPLPDAVRTALDHVTSDLKAHGGRVRWVDAGNLHVTVRFLGETEEAKLPKLRLLIDSIAAKFPSADTTIDRLGGFPNLSRPRVIWAGLAETESVVSIVRMARQVELAVRQLRFEPDSKGFKPHLTLGRVKDPRDLGGLPEYLKTYRFETLPARLDRLVLFQSTLTPHGPIYDRLHEAKLGEERLGG